MTQADAATKLYMGFVSDVDKLHADVVLKDTSATHRASMLPCIPDEISMHPQKQRHSCQWVVPGIAAQEKWGSVISEECSRPSIHLFW